MQVIPNFRTKLPSFIHMSRSDNGVVVTRIFRDRHIELRTTLAPLVRGRSDPTTQFVGDDFLRATRTSYGPATIRISRRNSEIVVEAWGAGAEEILERSDRLVGLLDNPSGFQPQHPVVRNLHRRNAGLRMTGGTEVIEALIPTILEQKVAGKEARRSFVKLVKRYGELAPGNFGLMLQPDPLLLAKIPYWELHSLGIERRKATTLSAVCSMASSLEAWAQSSPHRFRFALQSIPGIGPWSAAEASRIVHGDADAVSVGDFHTPNLVAFALAGEARATDERMLELLEPYRGHRARAVRLLEIGHPNPPKFAPRRPLRKIENI